MTTGRQPLAALTCALAIVVPPLAEQRRIVDLIGAVDAVVGATEEVAATRAACASMRTTGRDARPRATDGADSVDVARRRLRNAAMPRTQRAR